METLPKPPDFRLPPALSSAILPTVRAGGFADEVPEKRDPIIPSTCTRDERGGNMRILFAAIAAFASVIVVSSAHAGSVTITTNRDTSLYQENPTFSNGAGAYMYSGLSGGGIRRGLISFDIAGNVPAGATITSASLTLHMSRTNFFNDAQSHSLHVITSPWGEAGSDAGNPGGTGASADPGDATWSHAFFNTTAWTTAGGDFNALASATTSIIDIGFYSWSSPAMVADIQNWLNSPALNHGWILRGNESDLQTAKRFDTREESDSNFHPALLINYTEVPAPGALAAFAAGGLLTRRRRRTA
jgi:MYXO-CTERM domain-containing protein